MNSHSKDIAKMAAFLADDPTAEEGVMEEINSSRVVACLIAMRLDAKLGQDQVAEAMSCSASKVSRMESGSDLNLKWVDIVRYANALGLSTSISFDNPELPAAQRIKQCVFRIAEDLESLANLAKNVGSSDEIAEKIHQFYGEVLFNFLRKYQDNYAELETVIEIPSRKARESEVDGRSEGIPTRGDSKLSGLCPSG